MAVTVEDLGAFLQQPAPRQVPANIWRKKRHVGLLILGVFFLVFSIPFMWLFFPWRGADELKLDFGSPEVAEGRVTAIRKTHMTIGGGRGRAGTPVYGVEFEFRTAAGQAMAGVSYETGSHHRSGQSVAVEYLADDPSACRVKGLRMTQAGYWAAFVVLFPLTGLLFWVFTIRSNIRNHALLRNGVFARGEVTDVKATSTRVNNERVYKVTVSYDGPDGQTITTFRARGKDVKVAEKRMSSGEMVGLLYDAAKPGRVLMVDSLVG